MKVPQEGPAGVEFLIHEDGAFLTVEEPAPKWQFWRVTRRATTFLNRWGMIWLYQTVSKVMRRGVVEDGFNELTYDLEASFKGAPASSGPEEWLQTLEYVAKILQAKGWVKT